MDRVRSVRTGARAGGIVKDRLYLFDMMCKFGDRGGEMGLELCVVEAYISTFPT